MRCRLQMLLKIISCLKNIYLVGCKGCKQYLEVWTQYMDASIKHNVQCFCLVRIVCILCAMLYVKKPPFAQAVRPLHRLKPSDHSIDSGRPTTPQAQAVRPLVFFFAGQQVKLAKSNLTLKQEKLIRNFGQNGTSYVNHLIFV